MSDEMETNEIDRASVIASWRSRITNGRQLDALVIAPLRWVVLGLIPEGMGLLIGPPKLGKSWFSLGIALAVAAGRWALGKIKVDPRPVLYLALEDGDRRMQDRARKLMRGEPIPPAYEYMKTAKPNEIVPLIGWWLDEHPGGLVLLDTLGKVMPRVLPGEGIYERDYRIGSALKGLADAHPGSTVLIVTHTNKRSDVGDWMESTSGTNGLNGSADFTLMLSRKRGEDQAVIRVTGRDVNEGEYAATITDGAWLLDGESLAEASHVAQQREAASSLGDDSSMVLGFVDSQPGGVRAKDVAEHMGWPENKARPYLARLVDAGRLTRPSRGLYMSVTNVTSVTEAENPEPGENVTPVTDVTPVAHEPALPGDNTADVTDIDALFPLTVTDVTVVTDESQDGRATTPAGPGCRVCGQPLDASSLDDGFTTCPSCEMGAAS